MKCTQISNFKTYTFEHECRQSEKDVFLNDVHILIFQSSSWVIVCCQTPNYTVTALARKPSINKYIYIYIYSFCSENSSTLPYIYIYI